MRLVLILAVEPLAMWTGSSREPSTLPKAVLQLAISSPDSPATGCAVGRTPTPPRWPSASLPGSASPADWYSTVGSCAQGGGQVGHHIRLGLVHELLQLRQPKPEALGHPPLLLLRVDRVVVAAILATRANALRTKCTVRRCQEAPWGIARIFRPDPSSCFYSLISGCVFCLLDPLSPITVMLRVRAPLRAVCAQWTVAPLIATSYVLMDCSLFYISCL